MELRGVKRDFPGPQDAYQPVPLLNRRFLLSTSPLRGTKTKKDRVEFQKFVYTQDVVVNVDFKRSNRVNIDFPFIPRATFHNRFTRRSL